MKLTTETFTTDEIVVKKFYIPSMEFFFEKIELQCAELISNKLQCYDYSQKKFFSRPVTLQTYTHAIQKEYT